MECMKKRCFMLAVTGIENGARVRTVTEEPAIRLMMCIFNANKVNQYGISSIVLSYTFVINYEANNDNVK